MMFGRLGSFALNLARTAATLFSQPQPKKKRQFFGENGPEAAAKYLTRKNLHPGRSSSLRKLQRARRIAAGIRPLHYL